jgi:hypothetical protein
MADTLPDKIFVGIGQDNQRRAFLKLPDNTYVERTAPAIGSGLITDSTGQVMFDIASLPSKLVYDANGYLISATYGPDSSGRYVRQTTTWKNGLIDSESAWVMVTP